MKKGVFKFLVLLVFIVSCSDDDEVSEPVEEPTDVVGTVVLNEVAYLNNQVEIYNNSDATVDLDGYFLCLGPGTYRQIGTLETTGNVQLGAGEFLVVDYEMPNEVGGLGLYINNTGFGDAANIADFVQWGDGGTTRESVAVEAGLWTAGEFVAVLNDPDNTIIYDGEGTGADNWTETTSVTFGAENVLTEPVEEPTDVVGTVVLNEVAYLNNQVEIYNNSDATVDLDGYFLCLGPGTYRQIGALGTTGNVQLGAGEFLVVDYDMPNEVGGLGLYINNTGFGNAANIADFVQWGDGGTTRESVAVEAGLWTAGEFVAVLNNPDNTIIYDGEGTGADNWAETTSVTFGAENVLTEPVVQSVGSVVLNEVAYLNNQVEIYNNSDATVDLDGYFLCLAPGTYRRIGALGTTGNVQLGAGEFLVVDYDMPDEIGGLGLYINNSDFGDAATMADFVQWGGSSTPRENVAVAAGIWTAGDFVTVANNPDNSIIYDGEGNASSDWSEEVDPSLGQPNE